MFEYRRFYVDVQTSRQHCNENTGFDTINKAIGVRQVVSALILGKVIRKSVMI